MAGANFHLSAKAKLPLTQVLTMGQGNCQATHLDIRIPHILVDLISSFLFQ